MSSPSDSLDLIIHPPLDGPLNMAVDWWLTENADRPTLRFYRWKGPTLTVGYRQQFQTPSGLDTHIERFSSAVRPTGGGYLLHAGELTYSFVVPSDHPMSDRTIMESYRFIRDIWSGVFLDMGAIESVETGDGSTASPDCLDGPAEHEPVQRGGKWMAAAQVHHQGAQLQHGSIYVDAGQWPDRWPETRPSFLDIESGADTWISLVTRLVEGILERTSFKRVSPRVLGDDVWPEVDRTARSFSVDAPADLPTFRRS